MSRTIIRISVQSLYAIIFLDFVLIFINPPSLKAKLQTCAVGNWVEVPVCFPKSMWIIEFA